MPDRTSLPAWLVIGLAAVVSLGACGHKIGDSCSVASDCSDNADRICDTSSHDGYCTIAGCDFDTCPSEAVCVSFFPVENLIQTCEVPGDCSIDEGDKGFCAGEGHGITCRTEVYQPAVPVRIQASQLREKFTDCRAEALHVHEE